MQEITNKVESGANFLANNEGRAQGAINDISRKDYQREQKPKISSSKTIILKRFTQIFNNNQAEK